eukprot:962196_1
MTKSLSSTVLVEAVIPVPTNRGPRSLRAKKEKKELFIKNTYEKIHHDQVCVHKHSDRPIESRVQRIHHLHKFMENKAQPVLAERASGRDKESYLRCAHKQQSQSIESEEERIQHFHQKINRRMQQDPAVAVVARIPKQSDHPIESQLQRIQRLHKFMDNKMQHVLIERVSGQAKE